MHTYHIVCDIWPMMYSRYPSISTCCLKTLLLLSWHLAPSPFIFCHKITHIQSPYLSLLWQLEWQPCRNRLGLQTKGSWRRDLMVLEMQTWMWLILARRRWLLLLGCSLVHWASHDRHRLTGRVGCFGAEVQCGLGAQNLHVQMMRATVPVWLEEAVVDPFTLGADPLLAKWGRAGDLVLGKGAGGGVGAHGGSPAGQSHRWWLVVVMKHRAWLLLVCCHLLQLLCMRYFWPAGHGSGVSCLSVSFLWRGGRGGAGQCKRGPSWCWPKLWRATVNLPKIWRVLCLDGLLHWRTQTCSCTCWVWTT